MRGRNRTWGDVERRLVSEFMTKPLVMLRKERLGGGHFEFGRDSRRRSGRKEQNRVWDLFLDS